MPELSICIPTYNYGCYLPDAVGSIMRQGLSDFEIVICDNASEDDTEQIVAGFENPHIRYFRNEKNLGSRENGNRCMANARGHYIKFLCADDVFLEGVIARQINVLRQRPDISVVTCNMFVTDSALRVEKEALFFPGFCDGRRLIDICLSGFNNYIGGPTNVMFRREQAATIVADPNYSWVADLKYYLQLLEKGDYMNINIPGFLYRRHTATDTAMNCPPHVRVPEYLRLIEEFGAWNLISGLQAMRLGGENGWKAIDRHLGRILSPSGALLTLPVLLEIFRMTQSAKKSDRLNVNHD